MSEEAELLRAWRLPASLIQRLEEYFAKNPAKTKEKCVSELLDFALKRGGPIDKKLIEFYLKHMDVKLSDGRFFSDVLSEDFDEIAVEDSINGAIRQGTVTIELLRGDRHD